VKALLNQSEQLLGLSRVAAQSEEIRVAPAYLLVQDFFPQVRQEDLERCCSGWHGYAPAQQECKRNASDTAELGLAGSPHFREIRRNLRCNK
jgi:hypothetical protein